MGFLTMLLPALFPVISDVVKVGVSKLTGVSMGEPRTFEDYVELEKVQLEKLKVLGELDKPSGPISKWVADLRASFRYLAVAFILVADVLYMFLPQASQNPEILQYLNQLAGSAVFFIIGDRVYLGLKRLK